jgi:hypothetical protein
MNENTPSTPPLLPILGEGEGDLRGKRVISLADQKYYGIQEISNDE